MKKWWDHKRPSTRDRKMQFRNNIITIFAFLYKIELIERSTMDELSTLSVNEVYSRIYYAKL